MTANDERLCAMRVMDLRWDILSALLMTPPRDGDEELRDAIRKALDEDKKRPWPADL